MQIKKYLNSEKGLYLMWSARFLRSCFNDVILSGCVVEETKWRTMLNDACEKCKGRYCVANKKNTANQSVSGFNVTSNYGFRGPNV